MTAYLKAFVGAGIAGLTALGTALVPDSLGVAAVTPMEWTTVGVAALAAFGAVWAVPNKPQGE